MAALTIVQLAASTLAPHAQAIKASTSVAGTKFSLPVKDLGILADRLNRGNPLTYFTTGLNSTPLGGGSVKIEYNTYADTGVAKTTFGSPEADFNDATIDNEVFLGNTPGKNQEALLDFDLRRGTPNVLAQRIATRTVKFIQASIKAAFGKIVAAAITTAGASATAADGTALVVEHDFKTNTTALDDAQHLGLALANAATDLVTKAEASRDEVTIVINPINFDKLAIAGLIGNKVVETFAGGQYQVGIIGGYRIISGDMFIPATVQYKDSQANSTLEAHSLIAVIGTYDSVLHSIDISAVNSGPIGISNDLGTYLEASDIAAVPKRTVTNGLLRLVVEIN